MASTSQVLPDLGVVSMITIRCGSVLCCSLLSRNWPSRYFKFCIRDGQEVSYGVISHPLIFFSTGLSGHADDIIGFFGKIQLNYEIIGAIIAILNGYSRVLSHW